MMEMPAAAGAGAGDADDAEAAAAPDSLVEPAPDDEDAAAAAAAGAGAGAGAADFLSLNIFYPKSRQKPGQGFDERRELCIWQSLRPVMVLSAPPHWQPSTTGRGARGFVGD
jgi:hypothetical protein